MRVEVDVAQSGSDVDELAALRVAWGLENGRQLDDAFYERFRAWFNREQNRRVFFIARLVEPGGTAAIGTVNLVQFERMPSIGGAGGGWGYLSNMFVLPEHRNGGVGATMLTELLAVADGERLERVVLNPTERSLPFYERHGFSNDSGLMVRR